MVVSKTTEDRLTTSGVFMFKVTNLLMVDSDPSLISFFENLAKKKKGTLEVARSGEEAMRLLNQQVFEVAIVDLKIPGQTGMQLLEYVKKNDIFTEVIMIANSGGVESAVHAMRSGAYGYFTKPFENIGSVEITIEKAMERYKLMSQVRNLEQRRFDRISYEGMVGRSKRMQEVFSTIDSIAATNSTVLITGESGTGKEMVARAVHNKSTRRNKPFVVINCAAIPETLLESELFGHRRGSFTGAVSDKKGLFEEANEGTVFLDEVGEIPLSIQVKLLRVIQEGEVRAVGDVNSMKVDVRLVAATNKDLMKSVKEGNFREDLYYRLDVITIPMPALRERAEDIPLLTYHFLEKYSSRVGKNLNRISIDALQVLQNHRWIGNVRELENVIERSVVLCSGDTIHIFDLPTLMLGESFYLIEQSDNDLTKYSYREAKARSLISFNRSYIRNLLKQTSGNISMAADRAGLDRSNFKKLIKKYGVDAREIASPSAEWSLHPGGSK